MRYEGFVRPAHTPSARESRPPSDAFGGYTTVRLHCSSCRIRRITRSRHLISADRQVLTTRPPPGENVVWLPLLGMIRAERWTF